MDMRSRLEKHASAVAEVGRQGGSMQDKLAELIQANDLNSEEVRRIAEMANRKVQVDLYKVAEDKRFRFPLCDPGEGVKQAKAAATAPHTDHEPHVKMAAAIDEAGGDPFAPIPRQGEASKLSLLQEPLDAHLAHEMTEAQTREMLIRLDRARMDYESLKSAAHAAIVDTTGKARDGYNRAVQSAMDLIHGGSIGLPELYAAVCAANEGSRADPEVVKRADTIMLAVVEGLLDRGVPKTKMGFRFRGCPDELAKMSPKDLVALAKRTYGQCPQDIGISIQAQKQAQRYVELVNHVDPNNKQEHHPFQDAASRLQNRPSVSQYGPPRAYLEDAATANTPIRTVDGDCEFVIGVGDLIGEQSRLTKFHAAQEYLGLKLKQIENAMRELQGAQKQASAVYEAQLAEYEDTKEAIAPLVAAGGRMLAGVAADALANKAVSSMTGDKKKPATPKAASLGSAVARGARAAGSFVKKHPDSLINAAAMGAPLAVPSADMRMQRKMQKEQAG